MLGKGLKYVLKCVAQRCQAKIWGRPASIKHGMTILEPTYDDTRAVAKNNDANTSRTPCSVIWVLVGFLLSVALELANC